MWPSLVGAIVQGLVLLLTTQLGSIFLKLGIGLGAFAAYNTLFDSVVSLIQSAFFSTSGHLSSIAFQMVLLCGLPDAINIMLSAYSVRAAVMAMSIRLLQRPA